MKGEKKKSSPKKKLQGDDDGFSADMVNIYYDEAKSAIADPFGDIEVIEFKENKSDKPGTDTGETIIIDDMEQIFRAILNKAYPHPSFIEINKAALFDVARRMGLKPGKHQKLGITIKNA